MKKWYKFNGHLYLLLNEPEVEICLIQTRNSESVSDDWSARAIIVGKLAGLFSCHSDLGH